MEIAMKYREKINPVNKSLPENDINEIKRRITNKINSQSVVTISSPANMSLPCIC